MTESFLPYDCFNDSLLWSALYWLILFINIGLDLFDYGGLDLFIYLYVGFFNVFWVVYS